MPPEDSVHDRDTLVTGRSAVDAYIAALPEPRRSGMEQLRAAATGAAPDATEVISYKMPALRLDGRFLVSYDAFKAHYSLFPASDAVVVALGAELTPHVAGKGTIRFPANQPIPVDLVSRVVAIRIQEVRSKSPD